MLIKVLYPLLELHTAHNKVVSQAASTTLERLGLYLHYAAPLGPTLLRANLDYFVEEACARLRPAPHGATSGLESGQSALTHRVVDFVLSTVRADEGTAASSEGSCVEADIDHSTVESAMRELLLDSVTSMDLLAGAGAITPLESASLISMMRVLVNQAGEEAGLLLEEKQALTMGGEHYLASCLHSLRSFRRNLDVLLERNVEVDDAEAVRLEEEEGDAASLEGRERKLSRWQDTYLDRRRHEEAQVTRARAEQAQDTVQSRSPRPCS